MEPEMARGKRRNGQPEWAPAWAGQDDSFDPYESKESADRVERFEAFGYGEGEFQREQREMRALILDERDLLPIHTWVYQARVDKKRKLKYVNCGNMERFAWSVIEYEIRAQQKIDTTALAQAFAGSDWTHWYDAYRTALARLRKKLKRFLNERRQSL